MSSTLVMCFHTPFRFHAGGEVYTGEAGDCLVHPPGTPHMHGPRLGAEDGFVNDWLHIEGEDVPRLLTLYGVKSNSPISTGNPTLISEHLALIQREQFSLQTNWQIAVELSLHRLLLELGRYSQQISGDEGRNEVESRLVEVRMAVHQQFARDWTLEQMADMAFLSRGRFSVLYSRCFGVSPVEDLIRQRLQHSAYLLSSSQITVKEAAIACGFNSIYYFSRTFHRRYGCSPSDYSRTAHMG